MSILSHTETKTQAITCTIIDEVRCDLCKKVAPRTDKEQPWVRDDFDKLEVRVSFTEGYSYPESWDYIESIWDICPECFHKKLVPWLQSQGASEPRKDHRSY